VTLVMSVGARKLRPGNAPVEGPQQHIEKSPADAEAPEPGEPRDFTRQSYIRHELSLRTCIAGDRPASPPKKGEEQNSSATDPARRHDPFPAASRSRSPRDRLLRTRWYSAQPDVSYRISRADLPFAGTLILAPWSISPVSRSCTKATTCSRSGLIPQSRGSGTC
jgi:hypothetical protein